MRASLFALLALGLSFNALSNTSQPTAVNLAENTSENTAEDSPKAAFNDAKSALEALSNAIKTRNFDASFVVVKGQHMEPYRWLHGTAMGQELEHLSLLNGAGVEMVRIGDKVTYFEPQTAPYTIEKSSISGPIPSILFHDVSALAEHYDFVLGGKGRIAGRPAQLVRIEAVDARKLNYWVWLDIESSLLLKAAYVNQQGDAIEQLQLTHLSVTEQVPSQLLDMAKRTYPKAQAGIPNDAANKAQSNQNNWQIRFMPKGFDLLKADRHTLAGNNELADYYLFSDGLVDVSVFIQRPLAGNRRSGALSSGATTIYVHNADGYDVSVIGNIPAATAKAIAESVTRPGT